MFKCSFKAVKVIRKEREKANVFYDLKLFLRGNLANCGRSHSPQKQRTARKVCKFTNFTDRRSYLELRLVPETLLRKFYFEFIHSVIFRFR